jgi:hypothetical protein
MNYLNVEVLDPEWTTELIFDFTYEEEREEALKLHG